MILYPAIDIRDGHAVRLTQGDYNRETVYGADPVDAARRWEEDGARWLHVVDLDGARAGEPANLDQVRRIVASVGIPVQLGGGLRDSGKVEQAFSAGVERVILGTAAVRDPDMAEAIAAAHPGRVAGGVDARRGKVAAEGWTEESGFGPAEVIAKLAERGIERFIFTPVEVDGLMEGPDLGSLTELAHSTDAEIIYSGGVGSLQDLDALGSLGLDNVTGAIVGRALYEGRFTFAAGQAALGG